MNHDRLALFLASCTSRGFRRSLSAMPQDTLTRCGFDPGESGQIAASLARLQASPRGRPPEGEKLGWTYQKIELSTGGLGKAFKDDWFV
jgi:hypothetical protein